MMLRYLGFSALLILAACGGGGGGSNQSTAPPPPPPVATLALLAGNAGGFGSADGTGSTARFFGPWGVALDPVGNLYVVDTGNHVVRKVTAAGVVTTLPGSFREPVAVAVDAAANVYVTDEWAVMRISAGGVVSTLAGQATQTGGCNEVDGPVAIARFCFPNGIGVDALGNIFVASATTIRRISPDGIVSTLAGAYLSTGAVDGPGPQARFYGIDGIAVESSGSILVADGGKIRRVAPDGTTSTIAGATGVTGTTDGPVASAQFTRPYGLAIDPLGNIFVSDVNFSNYWSTVRRLTPGGVVSTVAGSTTTQGGSADGTGSAASFSTVLGLAVDPQGTIYATDSRNNTIRRISSTGVVTTLAGSTEVLGIADGTGSTAKFIAPSGIAIDSAGNLYVADGQGSGGVIRKVSTAGTTTTLAGASNFPGPANPSSVDGVGSAARFAQLNAMAINAAGQLFAADANCPGYRGAFCSGTIRRIAADGTVTTFAGSAGAEGSADGLGPAATFMYPYGLAFDVSGNLFVSDYMASVIRKIDPTGQVTTVAGSLQQYASVDGQGTAARFNHPSYIAFDPAGNLIVADGAAAVRRITPGGAVTTILSDVSDAGWQPHGIAIDDAGSIYLGDPTNSVIAKMPAGAGTTIIVGVAGQATFQPGVLPGRITAPRALAVRGTNLFFTMGDGVAIVTNRP